MPALFFPNLDALRLAVASGLIPTAIAMAPARVGSDTHGGLWLELDELPSRESLTALNRLGLRTLINASATTQRVECWAELFPLRSSTQLPTGLILFDVPDLKLAAVVSRLQRLHKLPVGVRLLPEPFVGRAWVCVHWSQSSASAIEDSSAEIRAYWQQSPNVWVARGWEHPLVSHLAVPPNHVVLCDPRGVVRVPGAVPEPRHDELLLQRAPVVPVGEVHVRRIDVRFRLKRCDDTPAETLWVLRASEQEGFFALCRGSDERVLRRYEMASVNVGSETRLLVRRVKSNEPHSYWPLVAGGFYPDTRLPWLFLPAGCALRPVIRIHELARELAPEAGQLMWLEAVEGSVAVHTINESAFRPLWGQLEYTAAHRVALTTAGALEEPFAFERFAIQVETTIDVEPPPPELGLVEVESNDSQDRQPSWMSKSVALMLRWVRWHRSHAEEASPQSTEPEQQTKKEPQAAESRTTRADRDLSSAEALLHGHDWARRRHELETRLVADFPHLSPDARALRWAELAGVYAATGQPQDAAVCWTNSLWDCDTPRQTWLEQWAIAECRAAKRSDRVGDLERWLGEPGRPGTGRVVASLAALHGFDTNVRKEFVAALPRVLAILEQQFDDIPVRAAWLARLAVARSCHGDSLGMARWHDRLIRRLHERGPGLDLDEPSFLRFRGRATADRFTHARDWLTRMEPQVREWTKKPAGISGLQSLGLASETDATPQYTRMMFAWGLGILGERTTSRDWSARARKELARATGPRADPAGHAFLGDLFLHRIREAHEGHIPKPGLPSDFQDRLDKLPEFARYSVDRLREYCHILQPVGTVRAYRGRDLKEFWGTDRLGEQLSVLGSRTDSAQINEECRALLGVCANTPTTATVPRIVLALLDVAAYLDAAHLDLLLGLVPTALEWLEAWVHAGRWSDAERDERIARCRTRILQLAFAIAPASAAEHLMRYLAQSVANTSMLSAVLSAAPRIFRTARRFELTTPAEQLIQELDPARAEWARDALTTERVGLAVGWYVAGDEETGHRILNAAQEALFLTPTDDVRHRTALALAYAEALGFAPASIALGRLGEIFQRLNGVTVHCSSNCYFTLQPLRLIDTVVRSVVTDDFTLGPAVRAWLDEDEFLIRRRIHRDMATLLRDADAG